MAPILLGAVEMLLAVQVTQGTVAGVVRDEDTGRPLAGAVVALTDLNRPTTTDAQGRYVLRQVPAGPQHITVRFIGYAPRTLHALVPRDGQLEINVSLRGEPVRLPTVEVRAPVIVRGVEGEDSTAFPDRSSSIAAVWNHPLLSEPDVLQALGGGEVVLQPESPSGVHIRGGASDHTAYLLDGIPIFSPYHAAGLFSAWNPDALSRLDLSSSAPSPADPHSLSGTVAAATRTPGTRLHTQGSASTTQLRLTLDGPLVAGAGFMVSLRSGFLGGVASKNEASYLRGETGDWLAKLEAPLAGGRIRLLGYDSHDEINASAAAEAGDVPRPEAGSNGFEWHSRSLGVEWRRFVGRTAVRVLSWSAAGDATSVWAAQAAPTEMTADRRDEGLLAAVEHSSARATTVLGIRAERSRTSYRIESDSATGPSVSLRARTPVAAVFAQQVRAIGPRIELKLGTSLAAGTGSVYLGPRGQLRWKPAAPLVLSGSYARTHQFAQSLRNAESVVGNVFPADMYIGTGAPGVPVARSDQGVVAAEYRPLAGVRLGAQAYERGFDGLLLVAPGEGEPFATGAFAVGSGRSRGLSVDVAVSTARLGVVASYGLQRTRFEYGASGYVPDHGTTHLVEGGLIVFPSTTSSIRLGATAGLGRRTTTVLGGLEWEACNLLDRGCQFGGSPHHSGQPLGGTTLPAYFRVDVGVRKHWHLEIGGHDALIALFGTVTNLFGQKNVLTRTRDPVTGQVTDIEMRPLAPLVAGLEWRF